ncbi:MAG: hypothetical protein JO299_18075 [Gammaproteobacteria bacterium]|nr:hypothetical protein [Gammaproteobacteria bacterium]
MSPAAPLQETPAAMDRAVFVPQSRGIVPPLGLALWDVLSRIRTWHVFVVALILRLPLVLIRPPTVYTENIKAGFTLAERGYLGDPFLIPTGPTAHLSPAYPVFVAAVRSITPSDEICLRTLAMILAVLTSCNIAALLPVSRALRLPPASGTIAALMWLIPLFSWIELSAEHETPFTVAALLGLVTLLICSLRSAWPTLRTGAGLGFATGLGAYFTPTMLPVAALLTLAASRLRGWNMKHLLAIGASAVLACAVATLPYTLRNHHTFGKWFFMRDNFGLELAMSNGPEARPTMDQNAGPVGVLRYHPFNSRITAALVRKLGEVEYNHRLQRATFAWIRANPRAFMTLVGERTGYMVLPESPRWYQRVLAGAISLMTIAGSVLLWRSRYRFTIQCLAAAIVGYLLVYLIIEHDIRYMYPVLFLESLIAGSFAVVLFTIWRERARPASLEPGPSHGPG